MKKEVKQDILVAGAGAIGSLFGGRLSQAGHTVTLIDGWRDHLEAINAKGLLVTAPGLRSTVAVKALHPERLEKIDKSPQIVILSVKSYDTERTIKALSPLLSRETRVVSCQNSINEPAIAAVAGRERTLGCVISFGARLEGPGHVRQLRPNGLLTIGEYGGGTDKARLVAETMGAVTSVQVTDNLMGHRWSKLTLNCMGNALLAVSGYTAEEMHRDPTARRVIVAVAAEIVRTAEACGVRMEPVAGLDPAEWIDAADHRSAKAEKTMDDYGRKMGPTRSSMVYDIKAGRPTEIDFLNGYVVKMAEKAGIHAEVNEAVVAIFKKLCTGEIEPHPVHLASIPI